MRNLQSIKCLMNISHCLHDVLSTSTWVLILSSLEQIEIKSIKTASSIQQDNSSLGSSLNSRSTISSKSGSMSGIKLEDKDILSDLNILSSSADSFSEVTKHFSNESLGALVDAIVELTIEKSGKTEENSKPFNLEKLLQIIEINGQRLTIFWPKVSIRLLQTLIGSVHSPNSRKVGFQYLIRLVSASFKSGMESMSTPESSAIEKTALNQKQWQVMVLEPLLKLESSEESLLSSKLIEVCLTVIQLGTGCLSSETISIVIKIIRKSLASIPPSSAPTRKSPFLVH